MAKEKRTKSLVEISLGKKYMKALGKIAEREGIQPGELIVALLRKAIKEARKAKKDDKEKLMAEKRRAAEQDSGDFPG